MADQYVDPVPPADGSWRELALCAQVGPEPWAPLELGENRSSERVLAAQRICAACPVSGLHGPCFATAADLFRTSEGIHRTSGIWGGYIWTEGEVPGVRLAYGPTTRPDHQRRDAALVAAAVSAILAGQPQPLAGLNGTEARDAVRQAATRGGLTAAELVTWTGRDRSTINDYLSGRGSTGREVAA
jgi:hypothetical protein